MNIYFAPLEGVTTPTFRNNHHHFYKGITKYYMPFISPNQNYKLRGKEKREFSKALNSDMTVIPQILSKNAPQAIWCIQQIINEGYDEINLNLGCPAPTVVKKGRGSAQLADLEALHDYLKEIFDNIPNHVKISIKTRIGYENDDQVMELIELYNKFPIYELIVHPRTAKDMYTKPIRYNDFDLFVKYSKHNLVYNGEIKNKEDYESFITKYPMIDTIMLGRGLLINPSLADNIIYNTKTDKTILKQYITRLFHNYLEIMDERNSLFKCKEIWAHMNFLFEDSKKPLKHIRKASNKIKYEEAVNEMFEKDLRG